MLAWDVAATKENGAVELKTRGQEIYRSLGVRPAITASGATTMRGGSKLRPEVMEAMNAAASVMVEMDVKEFRANEVPGDSKDHLVMTVSPVLLDLKEPLVSMESQDLEDLKVTADQEECRPIQTGRNGLIKVDYIIFYFSVFGCFVVFFLYLYYFYYFILP